MKFLISLSVFSLSLPALVCAPPSKGSIYESIGALSRDIGGVVYESDRLFGCSWEQQLNYYSRLKETGARVEVLLGQVETYLHNGALSAANLRKVRRVKEILACVKNEKLDTMEIHCRPNCPVDQFAATETYRFSPLGITLYKKILPHIVVCPKLMDDQPPELVGAIVLHELTHHCGAKDHDYFSAASDYWFTKPTDIERWHENADHYEYWFNFPFCVPGVDCPEYGDEL